MLFYPQDCSLIYFTTSVKLIKVLNSGRRSFPYVNFYAALSKKVNEGIIVVFAKADKAFYPASTKMLCKNMKKISLEDIVRSLEFMEGEVKVSEDIRRPAFKAVQRMIDLSLSK